MIRSAVSTPSGLATVEGTAAADAVWIDLSDASPSERAEVEHAVGIALPSRVRMRAIEPSSRLVVSDDALTMTYTGLSAEPAGPGVPVTCVLKGNQLVTVRLGEVDPEPFETTRAMASETPGVEAHDVFVMLVEESVDLIGDRLGRLSGDIDSVTANIFDADARARRSRRRTHTTMRALGRYGTEITRLQDSLTSLQRLGLFVDQHREQILPHVQNRTAVAALGADIRALAEFAEALAARIEFLLDAMLGLIELDQNQIMMVLSLTAAMFLPATLISSIFGMNFTEMPGLTWHHGFLICLGVMIFAALGVGLIFRWRRWM